MPGKIYRSKRSRILFIIPYSLLSRVPECTAVSSHFTNYLFQRSMCKCSIDRFYDFENVIISLSIYELYRYLILIKTDTFCMIHFCFKECMHANILIVSLFVCGAKLNYILKTKQFFISCTLKHAPFYFPNTWCKQSIVILI